MALDRYKEQFIDFMLQSGVLTFGDFTTKSGRRTPYFINTGNYVTGAQMHRLGEFYAETIIQTFGKDFNNLFGPAYKGIPLVIAASAALAQRHGMDVTYTFNRKEAKDHGEGGTLVGNQYGAGPGGKSPLASGRTLENRVLLVEDVTTAGTSVRECMPLIHSCPGTQVIGLVVSVDRMERGTGTRSALREIREEFGIRTASIVTLKDLLTYLEERKDIASSGFGPEIPALMRGYYEQYGAE